MIPKFASRTCACGNGPLSFFRHAALRCPFAFLCSVLPAVGGGVCARAVLGAAPAQAALCPPRACSTKQKVHSPFFCCLLAFALCFVLLCSDWLLGCLAPHRLLASTAGKRASAGQQQRAWRCCAVAQRRIAVCFCVCACALCGARHKLFCSAAIPSRKSSENPREVEIL